MYLYVIRNAVNGKQYIGITMRELPVRLSEHRGLANRHGKNALAKAFRKYGHAAFTATLIGEALTWEELLQMEREAIQTYNTYAPTGWGYNLTLGGEGSLGREVSEDARQRISQANTGRVRTAEHREAVGQRHRGVPKSVQQRAKIGAAQQGEKNHRHGKPITEEHKERVRIANTGKVVSEETRAKLRAARAQQTITPEIRENMRQAALARHARGDTPGIGVPKSAAHRAKLSAATKAYQEIHANPMQGRQHSEETRAKMARLKEGAANPRARAIEMDGVVYPSLIDAMCQTRFSMNQIRGRVQRGTAHYVDVLKE